MTRQKILLFEMLLSDSNPEIWRDIDVPDHYNFWELHGKRTPTDYLQNKCELTQLLQQFPIECSFLTVILNAAGGH